MCLYSSVYDVAKIPTDFILAPRSIRLSTGMFSKHARPNLLCFLKYLSARNVANYIQLHITCIPLRVTKINFIIFEKLWQFWFRNECLELSDIHKTKFKENLHGLGGSTRVLYWQRRLELMCGWTCLWHAMNQGPKKEIDFNEKRIKLKSQKCFAYSH